MLLKCHRSPILDPSLRARRGQPASADLGAASKRVRLLACMDALTMDSSVAPSEAPDRVPLSLQSRSRLWGQCEISFAIESASKVGLV